MTSLKKVLTSALCATALMTGSVTPAHAADWNPVQQGIINFANDIANSKSSENCNDLEKTYGKLSQSEIEAELKRQREVDDKLVTNKLAGLVFGDDLKAELARIADKGNDNLKKRLIECKVVEPSVFELGGSSKNVSGSSIPGFNTDTNGNKTNNGSSDNPGLIAAAVIIALVAAAAGAVATNPALAAQLNLPLPR